MNVTTISNPDSSLNLNIILGERSIRMHSSRPFSEAEKLFTKLPQTPAYFLGGIGYGYLLEHILNHTTNKLCLVYEPISPIFEEVLTQHHTLKKTLQDPRVILVQNIEDLTVAMDKHQLKELGFMIHRPYGELFSDEMQQVQQIIAAGIRKSEIGNATLLRFGKLWAKNIFRNMHRYFISQKLISYKNIGADKPAVIIGAGPSLAEAIPYLKAHIGKAFYIACDTAVPMMEYYNIPVDFVITVDPQEKNALYLRYATHKNHILVADPGIHDSSFEGYASEQVILMDSLFPFYPYFKDYWGVCGLLASGGSVSTSAFDFARQLQCDPIIMVGQDLSFTSQQLHNEGNILTRFAYAGYSRLQNYHTRHAQTTYPNHSQTIKGRIQNKSVKADARFILFRDWFSQEIPKTKADVIIAGMQGAYLDGAQHKEIKDAFAYLNTDINKELPTYINTTDTQEFFTFIKQLSNSIEKIQQQSTQILLRIRKHGSNLSNVLKETALLQTILEVPSNKTVTNIISVAVQQAVQKTLNMPDNVSDSQQLQIINDFCTEIVESLTVLKRSLSKLLTKKADI